MSVDRIMIIRNATTKKKNVLYKNQCKERKKSMYKISKTIIKKKFR